jgi:hypothetical protein
LLARARELEARSAGLADENPGEARRQWREAAELRLAAAAGLSYPVTLCSGCLTVTGWTGTDGLCDYCARSLALRESFSDPHGGWVHLHDSVEEGAPAHSVTREIASRLTFGGKRERKLDQGWLVLVDPDETGPVEPVLGFELEVAHRNEVETVDEAASLVRFTAATHAFDGEAGWRRLHSTRTDRRELTPAEFPVELPFEQLAEAWADYREAIRLFNAARWTSERSRRAALAERTSEPLAHEGHVSDLLDEDAL